jgi:hypothetical protein
MKRCASCSPRHCSRTRKLFCAAKTISFSVDSPAMRAVMKSSPLGYATNDISRVKTQLNLVNVGNAQILTIPGERCRTLAITSSARCVANIICSSASPTTPSATC